MKKQKTDNVSNMVKHYKYSHLVDQKPRQLIY